MGAFFNSLFDKFVQWNLSLFESAWNGLCSLVGGIWGAGVEVVCQFCSWASALVWAGLLWLFGGLWGLIEASWLQFVVMTDAFIAGAMSMVPWFGPDTSEFQEYFNAANEWIPLSEFFAMMLSLAIFWGVFCVFKYGWRLIPFFH